MHLVRVYDGDFYSKTRPAPGATTSKTAASLRPRCNSATPVPTRTSTSRRTIVACPVSKTLPFLYAPILRPTSLYYVSFILQAASSVETPRNQRMGVDFARSYPNGHEFRRKAAISVQHPDCALSVTPFTFQNSCWLSRAARGFQRCPFLATRPCETIL